MNKIQSYKEILLAGVVLLLLDAAYITLTKSLWDIQVASIQRVSMQIRVLGAIVCYTLLILGLYYFILRTRRSPLDAFLLGLLVYGVFDSTNYAIFKKWDWKIAMMDTMWGGAVFALTTIVVYAILR
jgi:uncharacterized membrane protein